MKICTRCEEPRELEDFHLDSTRPSGLQSICRYCKKEIDASRQEEKRNYHMQRKYGITFSQYSNLVEKQNSKCLICKELTEKLVVDHCHETNKVRGLLCDSCNRGLADFKDNIEFLKNAIEYLKTEQESLPLVSVFLMLCNGRNS